MIPTLSESASNANPISAFEFITLIFKLLRFSSIGSGCFIPGKEESGFLLISKILILPSPIIFLKIDLEVPNIQSIMTFIFDLLKASISTIFLTDLIYSDNKSEQ